MQEQKPQKIRPEHDVSDKAPVSPPPVFGSLPFMRKETTGIHPLMVVLVALALLEGIAAIYFYARYYSQSLVNISLQGKLDQTVTVVREKSSELVQQADLVNRLKGELDGVVREKRDLERGLAEKKSALLEIEQRLTASMESERTMRADAARKEEIASYLRKRFMESKELERQMQERLEELTRKQSEMEARLAQAPDAQPEGIPLQETTVTGQVASESEITGQILKANEKYNFVVINLGSEDGIAIGDEGVVESKGAGIAKAKVKKLYPKLCLADIIEESGKARAQKDFVVKFPRPPRKDAP